MNRYRLVAVYGLLAVLLSGCGRSPQTTFYTLQPLAPSQTVPPAADGITVAIAAVSLPDLVDRPQLVLPVRGSQVMLVEGHRWAEPLKTAIPRLLAADLSGLLGAAWVAAAPQYAATRADYRLFVDLQRFEATDERVLVEGLWSIKVGADRPLQTRRFVTEEPYSAAGGYDTLVGAYSRALGRLAQDIAGGITHQRNSSK